MDNYKTYTKKEIREELGISATTFNRWLQMSCEKHLLKTNYNRCQRVLTPKQYQIIAEILVIAPPEAGKDATIKNDHTKKLDLRGQ